MSPELEGRGGEEGGCTGEWEGGGGILIFIYSNPTYRVKINIYFKTETLHMFYI